MFHEDIYEGIKGVFVPGEQTQLPGSVRVDVVGYWFHHPFGSLKTGAPELHPWWKLQGRWPDENGAVVRANSDAEEVVAGSTLAKRFDVHVGDTILLRTEHEGRVVGIVTTGDSTDDSVLYALDALSPIVGPISANPPLTTDSPDVSRVEISARTRPEDAFARKDPEVLSPKQRELWYCRPYANSIAYQIREAIPGANAEQVRRVEQSEGNVLKRISGLMWLISGGGAVCGGFCGVSGDGDGGARAARGDWVDAVAGGESRIDCAAFLC